MLNKLRSFAKARKGAELVEIILGVVIAIALVTVAVTYIVKVVQDKTGDNELNMTV